jgi:hypothetical protein
VVLRFPYSNRQDLERLSILFGRSSKAKDREESFINIPLLLGRKPPNDLAESSGVHCADLFYKDAGPYPQHVHLRAERRRPSASRGRSNQDD